MIYTATQTEFTLDWHIATSVHLVAKGGKAHEMTIDRIMD